jgi:hypothetical protein
MEVEAMSEKALAAEFSVTAFPELLVHRRDLGSFVRYTGPRTAAGIVAHMNARRGPACAPLPADAIPGWIDLKPPAEGSPSQLHLLATPAAADEPGAVTLETLERAVENMRLLVRCAVGGGEAEGSAPPLSTPVRLRFARAFAGRASGGAASVPEALSYSGVPDEASVLRWLTLHSRPAVSELSDETVRMYVGMRDTGVAVLLLPPPIANRFAEQKEWYRKQLTAVSEQTSALPGWPVFLTYAHTATKLGTQLAQDYKVDPRTPSLLILDFTRRARKPPAHRMVRARGGGCKSGALAVPLYRAGVGVRHLPSVGGLPCLPLAPACIPAPPPARLSACRALPLRTPLSRAPQPGTFEVSAVVAHVSAFKSGAFSSGPSVLETVGLFFDWLFTLTVEHSTETMAAICGLVLAIYLASASLDRTIAAQQPAPAAGKPPAGDGGKKGQEPKKAQEPKKDK